jgi:hypothetical protein
MSRIRQSAWTRRVSLFAGMYAITATIIGVETGSAVTGLTLGLLGSSLKTMWAFAHSAMFRVAH